MCSFSMDVKLNPWLMVLILRVMPVLVSLCMDEKKS